MSRRLAITVGEVMPRGGSAFRNPADRTAHLIVIDQDTGRGVMLELATQGPQHWMPLPDVPLNLLQTVRADPVIGHAHGSSPFERGEVPPLNDRTLESDLAEDRG